MKKFLLIPIAAAALLFSGFMPNQTQAATFQVPIAQANSGSLGAGFDIRIDAEVIGSKATFTFTNPDSGNTLSGWNARIHEIYFQSGLTNHFDFAAFDYATDTVNGTYDKVTGKGTQTLPRYAIGGNPANPPGILPVWTGTAFMFDENQGKGVNQDNGLGAFSATFDILAGSSIIDNASLLTVLSSPDVASRIALHIGDCDGGESCVVDTWPPGNTGLVPVPPALWLFLSGLAGLGIVARRRKRATA